MLYLSMHIAFLAVNLAESEIQGLRIELNSLSNTTHIHIHIQPCTLEMTILVHFVQFFYRELLVYLLSWVMNYLKRISNLNILCIQLTY